MTKLEKLKAKRKDKILRKNLKIIAAINGKKVLRCCSQERGWAILKVAAEELHFLQHLYNHRRCLILLS